MWFLNKNSRFSLSSKPPYSFLYKQFTPTNETNIKTKVSHTSIWIFGGFLRDKLIISPISRTNRSLSRVVVYWECIKLTFNIKYKYKYTHESTHTHIRVCKMYVCVYMCVKKSTTLLLLNVLELLISLCEFVVISFWFYLIPFCWILNHTKRSLLKSF